MASNDFYKDLEKYKSITDPEELKQFEEELKQKHTTYTSEDVKDTLSNISDRMEDIELATALNGALSIVSVSYIAKEYFGKTRAWLYQRLNGNIVNGKPARLSSNEKKTLKFALEDIAKKIQDASSKIILD